jgi:hypothetical protein
MFLFPQPLFYTHAKEEQQRKQPALENLPGYGKVYHASSAIRRTGDA